MLFTRIPNCSTFLDGRVAWLPNGKTEENEWTINSVQHDILLAVFSMVTMHFE